MRHGDKIRHGNPCSNARLNCQKSAEAIAGRLSMTSAEGPNVRRFGSLRYSTDTQRKQKTSNEGWPAENRVEPEGMQGVPSVISASKNRRGGRSEYSGNLLEAIVARDNLNRAYKRLKANGGRPGVDGMTVDELALSEISREALDKPAAARKKQLK